MSSLLKFTAAGPLVGGDGLSLVGPVGTVVCSIVGTTGTTRDFQLIKRPEGPEVDEQSALALGSFWVSGNTATFTADAIGSYVIQLLVDGVETDRQTYSVEDEFGLVRLPDQASRVSSAYVVAGASAEVNRGYVTIMDRNLSKLRIALAAGGGGITEEDLTTALADYTTTTDLATVLADYLPLAGGTLSGALDILPAGVASVAALRTIKALTATASNVLQVWGTDTDAAEANLTLSADASDLLALYSSRLLTIETAGLVVRPSDVVPGLLLHESSLGTGAGGDTTNPSAWLRNDTDSGATTATFSHSSPVASWSSYIGSGSMIEPVTPTRYKWDVYGTSGGLVLDHSNAATIAVTDLLVLRHRTSGTAGSGVGVGVLLQSEDASGNTQDTGHVAAALSVATDGSEKGYIRLGAMDGSGVFGYPLYAWGNGRVGIGTGTTEPAGNFQISTAASVAASWVPAGIDKNNSAAANNKYISFQRGGAGSEKAWIGLNANDWLTVSPNGVFAPSADNTQWLGYVNLRWNLAYVNQIIAGQALQAGTAATILDLTGAGHVSMTAATEWKPFSYNLSQTLQWAAGTVAAQRFHCLTAPTVTGASATATFTDLATFAITGAPVVSTNAACTNGPSALWVQGGRARFDGRVTTAKGVTVASAGTLTLGDDGNAFEISGTTTINYITTTGWRSGAMVLLHFQASVTVAHNTGSVPGGTAALKLQGAANMSATADDTLLLYYDGTTWREVSRCVI